MSDEIKNKSKRPDFPMITARLSRLEDDVAKGVQWYNEQNNLYKCTKDNFVEWYFRLKQCVELLETLDIFQNVSGTKSISDLESIPSELYSKDDLDDVFNTSLLDGLTEFPANDDYTPKFILKTYRTKLQKLADTTEGMNKVSSLGYYLNLWFTVRYSPNEANSCFRYKASRIHEWIDLIILAFGQSIHNNTLFTFCTEFDSWLESIERDHSQTWILPKTIMQFQGKGAIACTKEALLLERIIKPILYDDDFYPNLSRSLEQIVIQFEGSGVELLTDAELAKDCPCLDLP